MTNLESVLKRRDKKAFLSDQCKEIEENNRMGKTKDLFKKLRDTKGTFGFTLYQISNDNSSSTTDDSLKQSTLFLFFQQSYVTVLTLALQIDGINIARRNINNLRYADNTTHMAESEEEIKSLLMKVKEESEKLT